jgi:hypothetical protein
VVRGERMIIGNAIRQMLHPCPKADADADARMELARRSVDLRNLLIREYGEVDEKVAGSIFVRSPPM